MRYRRVQHRYTILFGGGDPRLYGEAWHGNRHGMVLPRTGWRPAADVYESNSAFNVTIELAGVDQDELDVLLFENALVVEGRRQLPKCEPGGVYHSAEIAQGPFRIEVPLPSAVDADRVEAHYDRGLLTITLPRERTTSG